MQVINREPTSRGKEAIYIDPNTGEVLLSGTARDYLERKDSLVKAGNLLATQTLYVEDYSSEDLIVQKELIKESKGEKKVFATMYRKYDSEQWWVLRDDLVQKLDKPLEVECSCCDEPSIVTDSLSACPYCFEPVVACGGCMYQGYDNICEGCTNANKFTPIPK